MPLSSHVKKLVARPIQMIEVPGGVVLKRGATEFAITGNTAAQAVRMVLDVTSGEGASPAKIRGLFAKSDRKQIEILINNLIERHLLASVDYNNQIRSGAESHLDIFFSNFGQFTEHMMAKLNKIRLVILGVNCISRQLALSLAACGHNNYLVLDHPRHRNSRFFTKAGSLRTKEWPASLNQPGQCSNGRPNELGDCLVATSDFGSHQSLCDWNKLCLDQNVIFFPVVLKNLVGYVGPLVIPGETACFECFVVRLRSHSVNPQAEYITDRASFNGQAVVGFHPSMATILGDIAAFEITRFFAGALPNRETGWFLEVDLLAGRMMRRAVLKVPRCAACSPLYKVSETNLRKVLFPEDIWMQ